MKNKLIAPCGFECSDCSMFRDNIQGTNNNCYLKSDYPALEIDRCPGCRDLHQNILVEKINDCCKIYSCTRGKKIEYCYECDAFPCDILYPLEWDGGPGSHKKRIINLCVLRELDVVGKKPE